jgi:ABC-type Fe3+-hydroxamate transport system substrate-binding protein
MNSKILQQLSAKIVIDQIGNTVCLTALPKRIVCIVPSITELLFHLGLGNRVVGITKFCIHPKSWYQTKEKIGGTKNVQLKKVLALQPDLLIANKEENIQEQVRMLANTIPVYTSDIYNLQSALQMIAQVGKITGTEKKATSIIASIENNFSSILKNEANKKVLYLIWRNPYMTIGGDTFINAMLTSMGLKNIFSSLKRYPIIQLSALHKKQIDFIFLSSEPFPFKQKHMVEIQLLFPKAKIILVEGDMFSWYGSRLIKAPKYFMKLQKQIKFLRLCI